jgi:hypothetical protein
MFSCFFIRCGLCGTIPAFHDPSEIPTRRETTVGDAGSVGDAVACSVPCHLGDAECKERGSDHTRRLMIHLLDHGSSELGYRCSSVLSLCLSVRAALAREHGRYILQQSTIYMTWLA